jgi:transcriptional regulator with XRE-family HTH domain
MRREDIVILDDQRSPHDIDVAVGARVKAARLSKGVSQTMLAERVGLTFQQIQKYERGDNRISASKLVQIAGALSVPPMEFLSGLEDSAATSFDFSLFRTSGAMDLLLAFGALSPREQRALLRLARDLAGVEDREPV